MERHILVVLPHPDDESFGSAGTIALHTRAGTPVTYLCGTLGEMGRNMGKPAFANRETLPAIRKRELEEACSIMGISDLRFMGLRDKTIEFEDPDYVADKIYGVLLELKPSLVITHYPGHGIHPDHDALGAATVRAVSRLPKEKRPVVYCHAITRNRIEVLGEPDVVVDIRSVIDVKMAAIKAHRSQTEGMFKKWESDLAKDPALLERWQKEMYWIYKFDD